MVYVEIETGGIGGGKCGFVVHYYYNVHDYAYAGATEVHGRFDTLDDARKAAESWLDEIYGSDGWRHV